MAIEILVLDKIKQLLGLLQTVHRDLSYWSSPRISVDGIDKNEWRIVLIGKTGAGKSATANSILGKNEFYANSSASSVTEKTSFGEANRFGKKLLVIDTPGIFDTRRNNSETGKEISKCIGIASPGFHVVILAVRIGRFTEEEKNTVDEFIQLFGNQIYNYMAIVFTFGDELGDCPIDNYLGKLDSSSPLSNLLRNCGYRYVAFNNNHPPGPENDEQVGRLFRVIENLIQRNNGSYYHHEAFRLAEEALRCEMERQRNLKQEAERSRIEKHLQPFKYALRQEQKRKVHLAQEMATLQARQKEQENYQRRREEEREEELRRLNRRNTYNTDDDDRNFRRSIRNDIANEKPGIFSSIYNAICSVPVIGTAIKKVRGFISALFD